MEQADPATEVEIFGARYHVRGEQDREHLLRLASLVDRKMQEVASHVASGDTGRIAILAALNLAEELIRTQRHLEGERIEIEEKANELAGELAAALVP